MLVLPLYGKASNVSAQATEPYLKRINANSDELHRPDNRQNSHTCEDDTALTYQFNITALRALVFVSLHPRRLKPATAKEGHYAFEVIAWLSRN